ncbi:alpha/beta fold hydrolase [Actinocorallia sp. A-T 12471]|uniref:alpha/beta fold hydrolase n=1 Tax=Actinocorallia sp. A-T 12471 TaxID=3089813 RepID=UPI0029CE0BBB|nr:alpha/beta fold hydrolase [Actinocorallia sp. A-T 12471]MDX6740102.1 alpha/beta fold hydrolase [Actinocorallia sp. A-T 12471]
METSSAAKSRARVLPVAGLTAAALVAGLAATPARADERTISRGVQIPAFYDPPGKLPKGNGTIIRKQPLRLALDLPDIDRPLPGRATRIMYRSTDARGKAVAVTGAYIEPTKRWTGPGPQPLIALASGTMGQGDQCAPSLSLENPLIVGDGTVSFGYENLALLRLLETGVAVVVTDYVGLGATDRLHTYVGRVDEAHALLDAARAALRLPGTKLKKNSRIGLYGYSQGGGASGAAAELQPTYAPELRLAGAYVGAPPADLGVVIGGIDGSALAGALAWSINGLAQTHPSVRKAVAKYVNAAGKAALKDLSTMCVGDAILTYGFANSAKWTKNGKSLSRIIAADPALKKILAQQRIGRLKPAAPVRLVSGIRDDIVVHAQSRRLAADWCAKNAKVVYRPVELPDLGAKLLTNHITPLLVDQPAAISWLTDRLKGKSVKSTCAKLPYQP